MDSTLNFLSFTGGHITYLLAINGKHASNQLKETSNATTHTTWAGLSLFYLAFQASKVSCRIFQNKSH
jgi:hypothetical protein